MAAIKIAIDFNGYQPLTSICDYLPFRPTPAWKATLALILSTILLLIDDYYQIVGSLLPNTTFPEVVVNKAVERFGLYLVIPLLVVILVYREHPAHYGFTWGDWRVGLRITLLICTVAGLILFFAARDPAVIQYYNLRYQDMSIWERVGVIALDLIGWEFVYRGFVLFSLYYAIGPLAVVVQAVPFAMAHLDKPAFETLSTIFGGIMFGWVAWRTRSFVYPFLIHLFIMLFTVLVTLSLS